MSSWKILIVFQRFQCCFAFEKALIVSMCFLGVKLHRRFAFPLANFILLLLGLPFVMRSESQSIILGLSMALALGTGYLIFTVICAHLGNVGGLNPMLSAWLPVLFFGALGLTLFDSIED